jgi:hypothetical protein
MPVFTRLRRTLRPRKSLNARRAPARMPTTRLIATALPDTSRERSVMLQTE